MFVTRLHLTDFRNYADADVTVTPGVIALTGSNGQGKTNLVEALDYLATLGSHRVATDAPLVRSGMTQAVVRAEVVAGRDDPRRLLLEAEINLGRPNRARVNRVAQRGPRDLLGGLRTVVFAPTDLAIVQGDPAERRAFLDTLSVARWPRLAGVRLDYDRVLRQRNALLKSAVGRRLDEETRTSLDVWSDQLAGYGAQLLAARLDTTARLAPHLEAAYAGLDTADARPRAVYQSRVDVDDLGVGDPDRPVFGAVPSLTERLRARLEERRDDELRRGVSLVGPHRDDLALSLHDLPARGYASHGESWSLALALRLASFELLRTEGSVPVLILDDVFAELDAGRRARLVAALVAAEQVWVTAAVADEVPTGLADQWFFIASGTIKPMSTSKDVGVCDMPGEAGDHDA